MENALQSSFTISLDLSNTDTFTPTIILPPLVQEGLWAFYVSDFRIDLLAYVSITANPYFTYTRSSTYRNRILPFTHITITTDNPTKIYNELGQPTNYLATNIFPTVQSEPGGNGYDINVYYKLDSKEQPDLCILSGNQTVRLSINSGFRNAPLVIDTATPILDVQGDSSGDKWNLIACIMNLSFVRLR